MSSPKLTLILISTLLVLLIVFQYFGPNVNAQVDHSSLEHMSESIGWPMNGSTLLYEESDVEEDGLEDDEEDSGGEDTDHRRSLYYYYRSRRRRYYISYGALSANRIPCPARSGRSYYTHNCFKASSPVNPYSRGCSAITRCRR